MRLISWSFLIGISLLLGAGAVAAADEPYQEIQVSLPNVNMSFFIYTITQVNGFNRAAKQAGRLDDIDTHLCVMRSIERHPKVILINKCF